ncbi:MAG: thioredoxin family protein [Rubripirellula sp.]
MKRKSIILLVTIPLAMVLFAGCADRGSFAFRNQEPIELSSLLTDSMLREEAKSGDADSHQLAPSLVTLAVGEDLQSKIDAAPGSVLLDFYADWCGPCQVQGKILHGMKETANDHQTLMIKINIDDHPLIARDLQVEGIPTLMLVRDGRVAQRTSGVVDAKKLTQWMQ